MKKNMLQKSWIFYQYKVNILSVSILVCKQQKPTPHQKGRHLGLRSERRIESQPWEWGENHSDETYSCACAHAEHQFAPWASPPASEPRLVLRACPTGSGYKFQSKSLINLENIPTHPKCWKIFIYIVIILYCHLVFHLYVILHCFNKYSLSTYCVLDIYLDAGNTAVNKRKSWSCIPVVKRILNGLM